jgi:hypothetical protein
MTAKLIPIALQALTRDGWLLFLTRFARLFAYGSLSVILVFYLVGLGLTEAQSGLVLTLGTRWPVPWRRRLAHCAVVSSRRRCNGLP